MRISAKLLSVMALMIAGSIPGFADACQAGSLSGVLGTSCTIGSLNFDFGTTLQASGWYGSSYSYHVDPFTGGFVVDNYDNIDPANIGFTPIVNGNQQGFRLTTNFTSSSNWNSYSGNSFMMYLGVNAINGGDSILNLQTAADLSSGSKGLFGYGYAGAQGFGCNSTQTNLCTYSRTFGYNGVNGQVNWTSPGFPVDNLDWFGYAFVQTDTGWGGNASLTSGDFLYNTSTEVPEPATLALLGSGLIGIGLRRFRK